MPTRNYAAAFFKSWGAWMSGAVSVVLGVWVLFFEPRNEMVKVVFTWVAGLTAVATAYQLWAIEHRKYLEEKAKNEYPEFKIAIKEDFLYTGRTEAHLLVTYIPMVVSLVNLRHAEGAIDRYELSVVVDDTEYATRIVPQDYIRLERPKFDELGLPIPTEGTKEPYMDLSTDTRNPHSRGIPTIGLLQFVLIEKVIPRGKDCVLKLTAIDTYGRSHAAQAKRTRKQSGEIWTIREREFDEHKRNFERPT